MRDLPGVEGMATMTAAREVERQSFLITVQKRRMVEIPVDLRALEKRRSVPRPSEGPGVPSGPPPASDAPLGKSRP